MKSAPMRRRYAAGVRRMSMGRTRITRSPCVSPAFPAAITPQTRERIRLGRRWSPARPFEDVGPQISSLQRCSASLRREFQSRLVPVGTTLGEPVIYEMVARIFTEFGDIRIEPQIGAGIEPLRKLEWLIAN